MSLVAQDLGVSDSSLSRWYQQFGTHGEQAFPGSGHQLPEQEEVRRLKRELEVVRMERDILKKPLPSSRTHRCKNSVYRRTPA